MHDGRFSTLEEVIEHYNSGGKFSSTVDPLMKKQGVGLQLSNHYENIVYFYIHMILKFYLITILLKIMIETI